MSKKLKRELLWLTEGIGELLEDEDGSEFYEKGEECLDCINDLNRLLRKEKREDRPVFTQLSSWNILKTDLVPLLLEYTEDFDLVYCTVRLIVNLTLPPPDDSTDYSTQVRFLQSYKDTLSDHRVLTALTATLIDPLQKEKKTERDTMYIELVLTLFLNILRIAHMGIAEKRKEHMENLILAFQECNVMDTFVAIAATLSDRQEHAQWNVLALEAVALMLRDFSPLDIAGVVKEGAAPVPLDKINSERLSALSELEQLKKLESKKAMSTRHTRFGGFFKMQSDELVSSRTSTRANVTASKAPPPRFHYKQRKALDVSSALETVGADLQVRKAVRSFCELFLENCFNGLVESIKTDMVERRERVLPVDSANLQQIIRFFLCFHRHSPREPGTPLDMGLVASAVDDFALKYAVDVMILSETSKEWSDLSRAVGVLREMLYTLELMVTSGTQEEKSIALDLQTKMFYSGALLQTVPKLMKKYDPHNTNQTFFRDLAEVAYSIVKLLENYLKREEVLYVQKKKKKTGRKKKQENAEPEGKEGEKPAEDQPLILNSENGDQPVNSENGMASVESSTEQQKEEEIPPPPVVQDLSEEEEEEDEKKVDSKFQVKDFISQFANPIVLRHYCDLLMEYRKNGPKLNAALVKMCHKIATVLLLEPLFYQYCYIRLFSIVLNDQTIHSKKEYQDLIIFSTHTSRHFFEVLNKNENMFLQTLFWKSKADCFDILDWRGDTVSARSSGSKHASRDQEVGSSNPAGVEEGENEFEFGKTVLNEETSVAVAIEGKKKKKRAPRVLTGLLSDHSDSEHEREHHQIPLGEDEDKEFQPTEKKKDKKSKKEKSSKKDDKNEVTKTRTWTPEEDTILLSNQEMLASDSDSLLPLLPRKSLTQIKNRLKKLTKDSTAPAGIEPSTEKTENENQNEKSKKKRRVRGGVVSAKVRGRKRNEEVSEEQERSTKGPLSFQKAKGALRSFCRSLIALDTTATLPVHTEDQEEGAENSSDQQTSTPLGLAKFSLKWLTNEIKNAIENHKSTEQRILQSVMESQGSVETEEVVRTTDEFKQRLADARADWTLVPVDSREFDCLDPKICPVFSQLLTSLQFVPEFSDAGFHRIPSFYTNEFLSQLLSRIENIISCGFGWAESQGDTEDEKSADEKFSDKKIPVILKDTVESSSEDDENIMEMYEKRRKSTPQKKKSKKSSEKKKSSKKKLQDSPEEYGNQQQEVAMFVEPPLLPEKEEILQSPTKKKRLERKRKIMDDESGDESPSEKTAAHPPPSTSKRQKVLVDSSEDESSMSVSQQKVLSAKKKKKLVLSDEEEEEASQNVPPPQQDSMNTEKSTIELSQVLDVAQSQEM